MKQKLQSLLLGGIALAAIESIAATKTWDGSSSGNWATGANWSGGTAPVAGDDLVFPAAITQLLITNNFSPNRAFNSITFLGSNYVVHGSALILTNGIRVGTPGGNNANHTFDTIVADIQVNAAQSFFVTNLFTELVVQGDIALSFNTLTLDGDGTQTIFGAISGNGGAINKDGFGIANFETNNSFTGGCLIFDGRIRAKEPLSLGTTAGGTIVYSGGTLELQARFTNELVTLSGGTLFDNTSSGRWVGTVNVVSNSSILAAGKLVIDGPLVGTGNLTVDAALAPLRGELDLVGSQNNTYSGTLHLLDGGLVLGKAAGFTALSGPLIIGTGGTFNPTNAVVLYAGNNQMSSGNVTVNQDGTFDLNVFADLIGSLTMIGGVVTNTSSGFLQLGGNVNATSVSNGPARIRGQLNLGTATRTFFVTNGPNAADLEIDHRVFGAFNLNKDGAGVMSLLASNSMSGVVHVLVGTLQLDDDFALGTLGGDRAVVHDGATLSLLTGANNIAQNLTLNGDGDSGIGALRSVGTMSWDGSVTLATDCSINVASGTLTITGQMDGAAGFAKIGTGTLRLSGTSDNIYAGDTTVRTGVLELSKTSAFAISNSASLFIGDASDNENNDTVRYAANSQIRTTVNIFINRTGVLDLNNFTDDVGDINMVGGTIDTGTGVLQLRGNLTAIGDTAPGNPLPTFDPCEIIGNLDLGTSIRTFTVNDNPFLSGVPEDLLVYALVSGSGGIAKEGGGELYLSASNTYSGCTTINAGRIIAANNTAFGTTSCGTVVDGSGAVEVRNDVVINESLNLEGPGPSLGAVYSSSGTNQWNGTVVVGNQTNLVNVLSGSRLDFGGALVGGGGLVGGITKTGAGVLGYLGSSANNYTGATTVVQGMLVLGKSLANNSILGPLIIGDGNGGANADVVRLQGTSQLGSLVAVTINSSGLFDLNGITETFGSLAGSGNVTLGGANLNPGGNGTSTLFSGVISESGSFTKSGAGTMTLSGPNSYTGATTVSAGTLLVNGSQPQSPVTVGSSATLGGTGTVGVVVANGSVAPGASPGALATSNLVFSASGDFFVELTGPTAGVNYDQLNVHGTNNLGNAVLHVIPAFTTPPTVGQQFMIIANDGSDPITGTFNGLPEGAGFNAGPFDFRINYGGGSGNDVVLTLTNIWTDFFFTNVLGGDFLASSNWLVNAVPGAANNANFTNLGSYNVSWTGSVSNANAFFTRSGEVTQSIGAFTWQLTNSYLIGPNAGGSPSVTQISGTLRVTNSAGSAVMEVRRGSYQLNGGITEADRLMIGNASIFEFNGGTLITRGGVMSNFAAAFTVGNSGSTPAIWSERAGANTVISNALVVGGDVSRCQVLVTNGGKIFNESATIGAGTVSNLVLISGAGSLWNNSSSLFVGNAAASFNQVVVSNSGSLMSTIGHIGVNNSAANSNAVIITGSGSTWSNNGVLNLGADGRGNRMIVTNGGAVFNTIAIIGANDTAEANVAQVTGVNSFWNNNGSLTVGQSASSNQLVIQNGGTVFATSFTLGALAASTNNQALVDGGTLRVTNASKTALFDIRRGSLSLNNAGIIEADVMRLTNAGLSSFTFSGGNLSVRSSTATNGQTFLVGNGFTPATLNLVGSGSHSFSALTFRSNSTLIGNGTIIGPLTVLPGASAAPGTSVGKIALSNSPSLHGSLVMEISKNGATRTNDQLQVSAALIYDGTLTVTDIGPSALALGDVFQLFNAASYGGNFSTVTLPSLAGGLTWTNKLLLDGSIQVVATPSPQFSNLNLSGTNLVISGSNGIPNSGFTVLASTNVALAVSNWSVLTTGLFNGSGNFTFTNVITPALPQRYFLLREP